MIKKRLLLFSVGVAATATLAFLMVPTLVNGTPRNGSSPERHADGAGPLGSGADPGTAISHTFGRDAPGGVWTLGIPLCLAVGDKAAILDGIVQPTKNIGNGFKYEGALVRQFVPAQGDSPIGSVAGFPPKVSETLSPPAGFVVTNPCQGSNPDLSKPYNELLLGFARGSGPEGGGWNGVDIGYEVGGQHHIVELRYDILMCGTAVQSEYCAAH